MGNNPRRRPGRLRLGTVPARSVQSPRAAKAGPWSQGRGGGGGGAWTGKGRGRQFPSARSQPCCAPVWPQRAAETLGEQSPKRRGRGRRGCSPGGGTQAAVTLRSE